MAKVTVAIPIYNADKYLEDAILSVLSQTFQDFDLWLVDDGSSDSSLAICEKFLHDTRVKIFADGKNLKLSARLNMISQKVKTEFLLRMDSDDIMHPEKIEKQLKVLESHPEIDILSTNLYSIDENNRVQGKRFDRENSFLGEILPIMHPTVMARSEWFKQNPYDEKAVRVEDAELWLRTKEFSTFRTMGEPLFFYREIGNKYYKRYFQGFRGVFYMLRKNIFKVPYIKFCLKYFVASFVYFLFYIFGKEYSVIQNRNQIKISDRHYSDFI